MGLLDTQPRVRGGLLGSTTETAPMGGVGQAMDKAGIVDYLLATVAGGLGGAAGLALDQRQQGRRAKATSAYNAQIGQQAQQVGWTPTERLVFSIDPKKALEMVAERTKPQIVNAGDSVRENGKFSTAPKLTQDANIYGTQTADGWSKTGERGATIPELETARNNLMDYNASLTPEGFLPQLNDKGEITGSTLMQQYGQFAKDRAAAGATRVNVPITLPAQNAFAEQMAKNYADKLDAAQTGADTARDSLRVLSEARKALQGGAITGAGAGLRLNANRALALVGDPRAANKVQNTETFRSVMGGQVLAVAKQLGSGAGITDADRKFAQEVSGGSIELNPGTINRLIDIQQRQAQNTIGRAQSMGAEAFGSVPSAQGLPQSAFGAGARGGQPQAPAVRRYNPATGALE